MPIQRERFELADGDFVDIDWLSNINPQRIVLILSGLEGSIDSPYARGMLRALHQHGWGAGLLHFRGCSGEPNRLSRTYHAGDTHESRFFASLSVVIPPGVRAIG